MSEEVGFYFAAAVLLPVLLFIVLAGLYRRRRGSKENLGFLVLWNLVFAALLVSLAFAAGETYFRFFVDTTDSFALNKISERWGKRYWKVNNLRVRDNLDYRLELTPGGRRISFIGDSFTAGHGVADVNARFGNLIRRSDPGLEVHVLAGNGLDTASELALIKESNEDKGYEFDVIVLVYTLNDIDYLVPETQEIYHRILSFDESLNFLARNSYLINTLYFRWIAVRDPDMKNYGQHVRIGYFSDEWEVQKRVLSELRKYVRRHGWRLLVVTFPLLHDLGEDYGFRDVHERLGAFWQANGVPHLDLLGVLEAHVEEGLTVNSYDAHPNEHAHRIAARHIEPFIRSNL